MASGQERAILAGPAATGAGFTPQVRESTSGNTAVPDPASTSPLAPRPRAGRRSTAGSKPGPGPGKRPRVSGKSEPSGPEGGGAAGGLGAVPGGNRKEAGEEGVPQGGDPSAYHNPRPRRGGRVP